MPLKKAMKLDPAVCFSPEEALGTIDVRFILGFVPSSGRRDGSFSGGNVPKSNID